MADDEQFSLCWNNFNTNLSAGFHESLCRGDLVDVSLAAEGHIVKAHRLVLSVCSPFFRKMFTQMPSNTHAIVFLNNVSHSALKDLIQFMYCGEVNVKQDALPAFISTAESLQIKGLTDNDPAPQPPQEPTPPPQASPHVQQQQQQVPAQRIQRQQARAPARYKIETVEDGLDDDNKGGTTTQIVIQTSAAPAQATIVQQQQTQPQTQQIQTGTTTTATLGATNKRSAQRSSLTSTSGVVKRSKTSLSASSNIIDPLEATTETATTTSAQLVPQITVQTTVVSAGDSKLRQQHQQQQEEAEYIGLPIDLPTKSEPDYVEDAGDAAGDGETTYVEDDAYGDMRYDESYFTENEDGAAQGSGAETSANVSGNVTATTSKAVVKQSQSYSDSSYVDAGADQSNTEAQDDVKQEPNMTPPGTSSPACLLDDESFRKPYSLPKILDGKFYKNIQPNQKTPGAIQATCTTCFGLISGTTKSTGNFLSHIKRRHKELLPLCQLYCQAKNAVVNSSTSAGAPPSVQMVNKLPQLNTNTVTSTTPATLELTPTVPTQLPTSYAATTTHLAVPVTAVPMSLPIPIAIPTVQAPQMVALMTQPHQGHGAVFISKDF